MAAQRKATRKTHAPPKPAPPERQPALPFKLPTVSAAQRKRAFEILEALRARYPDARCALEYGAPHELLIATILSAQTTDANVNRATPALFERYPTPADYAKATPEEIEPYVRSLGFFRNKSKAIHSSMKDIALKHGGEVPRTMEALLELRGVARKTANVVLGNAYGINAGFVVDTHIERLSKRFGLAPAKATVAAVERRLMALFPREAWTELSHLLIAHGRAVCKARGGTCAEDAICRRFCKNAKAGGGAKKKAARKPSVKKKPGRKKKAGGRAARSRS